MAAILYIGLLLLIASNCSAVTATTETVPNEENTTTETVPNEGNTTTTTTTTATATTAKSIIQLCSYPEWNDTYTTLAGESASAGSSKSELSNPHGVFVDSYDEVYVADTGNNRIILFSPESKSGTIVSGFTLKGGKGNDELDSPTAFFVTRDQTLFIADSGNARVQKWKLWDKRGYTVAGGKRAGATLDKISMSYGLYVDDENNVYVSEHNNHRVTLWMADDTDVGLLVAGGNGMGKLPKQLANPWGIYVTKNGTVYIADFNNHRIQKWAPNAKSGLTVAGDSNGVAGSWQYQLSYPRQVLLDQYGNMFILDTGNNRIVKWPQGWTYGLPVIYASSLNSAYGMHFSGAGNLIVADTSNHRIISFSIACPKPTNHVCQTAIWTSNFRVLAGTGTNFANSTPLSSPLYVAFDARENMYIVDEFNHAVQRFNKNSKTSITIAGLSRFGGNSLSQLYNPTALFITHNDIMYIADNGNKRILKWSIGQNQGRIANGANGSRVPLNQISQCFGIYVDAQSNLYVSDYGNHRVVIWDGRNTTNGRLVAGGNGFGTAENQLHSPYGIYVDKKGILYIVEQGNHRVSRWLPDATSGVTIAGESGLAGSWSYELNHPTVVMFDQFDNMFILDTGNKRIQKWAPESTYGITVALLTGFTDPRGMSFDTYGSLVVADRKINGTGVNLLLNQIVSFSMLCPALTTTTTPPPIVQALNETCSHAIWDGNYSTIAGISGSSSTSTLHLNSPHNIFVDNYDNVYVADGNNHRIIRFSPGKVLVFENKRFYYYVEGSKSGTNIAGIRFTAGKGKSELNTPTTIFVTGDQTLFILDAGNFRVQKWKYGEPLGFPVAGRYRVGNTSQNISFSYGLHVDDEHNVYVSDHSNHRVMLWMKNDTSVGIVVAGGNGMGKRSNQLSYPWGIQVTKNGTIYIADSNNHRIQMWTRNASSGLTVAGALSDGPGPWQYQLNKPTTILLDRHENMFILDTGNNRILKWTHGWTYGVPVGSIASMKNPYGMQFSLEGNIVVADTNNHRIISFPISCCELLAKCAG
ncbi:unnamed protein product [Rotaria socialis]|uniref:Peptidylamidoglycolate lyase n=4 Tax=Rotaria socialis TaxID=392032 RepID=A0A818YFN3_9BILA|nr:unnamed protein product [Rotaria socialis]CAF4677501.1 unnamed protein product [Rotaria socialis]